MNIRTCKCCGFILGTRPNTKDIDGVCLACYNKNSKNKINWKERQEWLTSHIAANKNPNLPWECVVGVSGGKDSTAIVKRLIEKHGVKNPLLVHVCDEFTPSEAGKYNINNLVETYGLDIINYRCSPKAFIENTRRDFFEELHPLKWIEQQLFLKPIEVAKAYGIKMVFIGENPKFEYGETNTCDIMHPDSTEECEIIYMGAIWPYSTYDALEQAKDIGFKTLSDFTDWKRQGTIEDFTQIDSKGYMIHLWTKFIKFGFQRVSDMATRFVREEIISKEQALQYIKDYDWMCDPVAKEDFCRTTGITDDEFNQTIDKFANTDILVKDVNGNWRRKDLL